MMMNKTKTLHIRVYCEASYNSKIQVPADLSIEEAFAYANEHLDEIPLTQLNYLPDSDNLDKNDLDNPHAVFFMSEENIEHTSLSDNK